MSHSYPHVPPHPKFPTTYGDNGSLTQWLARRVLNFRPSRLNAHWTGTQWILGASIAKRVEQGSGRNAMKRRIYESNKNWKRENRIVKRFLVEVAEDGKL